MLRQKVVIKIIPGQAPMRPVTLRALPLIMALLIAFFCFKRRFSRQRHTQQTSENSFLLGWTCPLLLGNSKHKRAWSNIKINLWVCHSPPPPIGCCGGGRYRKDLMVVAYRLFLILKNKIVLLDIYIFRLSMILLLICLIHPNLYTILMFFYQ